MDQKPEHPANVKKNTSPSPSLFRRLLDNDAGEIPGRKRIHEKTEFLSICVRRRKRATDANQRTNQILNSLRD